MDREEIAKIKKAICLIHHEDEYYEGMDILARLVGWPPSGLGLIEGKTKKTAQNKREQI